MSLIRYMPRPQKRRGNNGGDRQHIINDSKQSKSSVSRGRTVAQRFLKSTIYNKKMNCNEITMNLYTYKLNEIPGIIDEIIRSVVVDAPNIKRICFETGYGKPKKSIDIRKCCSHYLTNNLQYTASKGGDPKTFKFLSDHANRLIIFPQSYQDYAREQTEIHDKQQAIMDAKNAKKERKANKRRKKHFVHNKWKKNLKYPEPKKKSQPIVIYGNDGEVLDSKLITPGGNDDDDVPESDDSDEGESSNQEVEETEHTFLSNFNNLQIMIQQSKEGEQPQNEGNKSKRSWNKHKKSKEVDIFKGVKHSEKFEYIDPDYQRYRKKPELIYNKKDVKQKRKAKDLRMNMKGDWHCEFCSFKNSLRDEICQMCYAESFKMRYNKFMDVVNANNKMNDEEIKCNDDVVNAENNNKYKWHCDVCTFINTGDTEVCGMCGTTNEYQEDKLDHKYESYDNGFFADYKPKQKRKEEERMDEYIVENKKEIVKEQDYAMNGQIASINRKCNASVWKAYNDKQKRMHKKQNMNQNGNISNDFVGFVPHKKQNVQHGNRQNDNRHKKGNLSNRRKQRIRGNKMQNNGRKMNGMQRNQYKGNIKSNQNKNNNTKTAQQKEYYGAINFEWIDKLVNMGFAYDEAFDAVANTESVEFNGVLDHLMQNV